MFKVVWIVFSVLVYIALMFYLMVRSLRKDREKWLNDKEKKEEEGEEGEEFVEISPPD